MAIKLEGVGESLNGLAISVGPFFCGFPYGKIFQNIYRRLAVLVKHLIYKILSGQAAKLLKIRLKKT